MNTLITPASERETVIQVLSGPFWSAIHRQWHWSYLAFWWNMFPAFCGKCGRCTNPNNVTPCGHPEASKHVRGQVFVSSLEDHERRALEGGHTVRYVRDGKTIGTTEATTTP